MFELTNAAWWWVAAGVLIIAELLTTSFYLLMLALGMVAAALAAHLGAAVPMQLIAAVVMGGASVVAWHVYRKRLNGGKAEDETVLNMDIGAHVHVDAWSDDGTARVHYRGASWAATYGGVGQPQAGLHVIKGIKGTRLVLDR